MDYEKIYTDFLTSYRTGMMSAEAIGEAITKLAHCYGSVNFEMVEMDRKMNIVAMTNEQKTDDNTGKQISSTKASVFTEASQETYEYKKVRAKLQNIETYINALKSLQKGILNEYSNSTY